MIQTYQITGMTCNACARAVHDLLSGVAGVKKVQVRLKQGLADIETDTPVQTQDLISALSRSMYQLAERDQGPVSENASPSPDSRSEQNKKLVRDYITALGQMNYNKFEEYLHPDFEYNGAMKMLTAREFIGMIREHADSQAGSIIQKNDIKAIFVNGNESCVIYDLVTDTATGNVPFVEWLEMEGGKILSTEVHFDKDQMTKLMKEVRQMGL